MKTIEITQKSYVDAQKFLFEEIKNSLTNVDTILTNGNIASLLQDDFEYALNASENKLVADENGRAKIYSLGKFKNVEIFVDPYMLWTDARIILKNKEEIVEELLIVDNDTILV